jgi:hypothetical protein
MPSHEDQKIEQRVGERGLANTTFAINHGVLSRLNDRSYDLLHLSPSTGEEFTTVDWGSWGECRVDVSYEP